MYVYIYVYIYTYIVDARLWNPNAQVAKFVLWTSPNLGPATTFGWKIS